MNSFLLIPQVWDYIMMAVTALSLPSIIMLRKAVKPQLLTVFVGIVAIGIVIIGYTFNAFQFLFI